MRECFQFKDMNMLEHGEDVRAWYVELRRIILDDQSLKLESRFDWVLPSWINSPIVRNHFLTADDESIRLYQIYHDCGKPLCREVDDEGRQHFPCHAATSKRRWLECGGSQHVADLIGMDMDVHLLKADGVAEFASRPQALTLLLTALCEVHSNAQMFGGTDSAGFKAKYKKIDRFGSRIVEAAS